jgi:hypothetical protein
VARGRLALGAWAATEKIVTALKSKVEIIAKLRMQFPKLDAYRIQALARPVSDQALEGLIFRAAHPIMA